MAGHLECAEASFNHLRKTLPSSATPTKTDLLLNEIEGDLKALNACKGHMSGVLNRALDLVRAEVGLGIETKTMDIEQILDDVLRLTADHRVSVHFSDDRTEKDKKFFASPLKIRGDGLRLKQVLLNLCSNALNHTELGELDYVKLEVCVKSIPGRADHVSVLFSVSDSGCGILPGDIDKIFTRMFSTRVTKGGIGLGLTISQRLVVAMSKNASKIEVASPWPPTNAFQGTRFFFTIDMEVIGNSSSAVIERSGEENDFDIERTKKTRVNSERVAEGGEEEADERKVVEEVEEAAQVKSKSKSLPTNLRVLVVDDMQTNRKIISRKLTTLMPFAELGWSFEEAKTGEEALQKLGADDNFDIVWMDEILTNAGGALLGSDTISIIREQEKQLGRKARVIVSSTGNTTEKDCVKYMNAGADMVAGKPTPDAKTLEGMFKKVFEETGYM